MRGKFGIFTDKTAKHAIVAGICIALIGVFATGAFASLAEMYASMGQKYMKASKFDLAVLAFEQAVALEPDSPEMHNALGEAYLRLLRFKDALAQFNKALELKPGYIKASINRRRAMASLRHYAPVKSSRLSGKEKITIVAGITVLLALGLAIAIYALD